MSMKVQALLYRRVSTSKQDNSMEAQESLLALYCEGLEIEVVATLADNDTSGSIPMAERPGGGQLLAELARRRLADPDAALAVVCAKQDRLGRDTVDQIQTVRRIWDLGAVPHLACEGGATPRTPTNELLFELKAAVAQHERNTIRERICIGLDHKRSKGELIGTVPYGWQAVPTGAVTTKGVAVRELVDDDEEQHWIREMVRWRAAGWSYHKIALELNRLHVPTKAGKVGGWQCGNASKVINNKTVHAWLREQQVLDGMTV